VSNTEFDGGHDGHGHGDYTFLAKQARVNKDLRVTCTAARVIARVKKYLRVPVTCIFLRVTCNIQTGALCVKRVKHV
jgi:hypothetical protein